jgi:hypothetical protein
VYQLLCELRDLLVRSILLVVLKRPQEHVSRDEQRLARVPLPARFHTRVLEEMDGIGWQHVVALADRLDEVKLALRCGSAPYFAVVKSF